MEQFNDTPEITWQEKYLFPLRICVSAIEQSLKYETPQEAWSKWENPEQMMTLLSRLDLPFKSRAEFVFDVLNYYVPEFLSESASNFNKETSLFTRIKKEVKRCSQLEEGQDSFISFYEIDLRPQLARWYESEPWLFTRFLNWVNDLCLFTSHNGHDIVILHFELPAYKCGMNEVHSRRRAKVWMVDCIRQHFPDPLIYWKQPEPS
jgi:hypothetical protein